MYYSVWVFFFFQAEDGIRDLTVTGVQTCALPISLAAGSLEPGRRRQDQVGVAARRIVHEEVVRSDQVEPLESGGDAASVGEGRHHVGAEEEEHAYPAVLE